MLILASGSIRRKEILEALGAEIKIITADVDEHSNENDPEILAPLLAKRKGLAVGKPRGRGAHGRGRTHRELPGRNV